MENNGIFDKSLSSYVDQMTDGMRPDADRIIPKLLEWINEYDKSRSFGKSA